jgi:DNA polymerase-3 subunit epsilon
MNAEQTAAVPPDDADDSGWAVVDVETTGLGRNDRIVSAAVYRLDADGDPVDHWYTTVNPERDPGPVFIHGLTSDVLAGAPTFAGIAEEFAARLAGRVLVAHNALFDWSMIAREFARIGVAAPVRQRLCTIVLSRDLKLPLRNHKLGTLAAHFGVRPQHAHHALDDARVLAEAFQPCLRLARESGMRLPLQACLPPASTPADPPPAGDGAAGGAARSAGFSGSSSSGPAQWYGSAPRSYRPHRRRPACPYPNPGRWEPGGPLVQGMRVAISGDTSVDREELEDRAVEAGLHVAGSVSRLTSLLVTNEPDGWTGKARRARDLGTPVVDEAGFVQLLAGVVPADGAAPAC